MVSMLPVSGAEQLKTSLDHMHAAHDFGQRRVFLVGQARAVVAGGRCAVHRQEQVPQAGGLGFGFELFDGLQRCPALACGRVGGDFGVVGASAG